MDMTRGNLGGPHVLPFRTRAWKSPRAIAPRISVVGRSLCHVTPSRIRDAVFVSRLFLLSFSNGSHSLWAFSTFIVGDTPFPEFSAVVMLDDVQLSYYDSDEKKLIYKEFEPDDDDTDQKNKFIFEHQYDSMKYRALYSSKQLNITRGVHVHQRLAGCELLDDNLPGPLRSWDAFEGVNEEVLYFNTQLNTLQSEGKWPNTWDMTARKNVQWMYAHFYSPVCFEILERFLQMKRNHIMRLVKPRVWPLQKAPTDSGGTLLTCLASGFYPRHISLTLLRDGQPVPEQNLTGGEVLPNGDGTYQLRTRLEVSAEESREQHIYTCTVTHPSLDNTINITMEIRPPEGTVFTISVVIVVVLLCMCVVVLAFLKFRTRNGQTSPQNTHSAAFSRVQSAESSDASITT